MTVEGVQICARQRDRTRSLRARETGGLRPMIGVNLHIACVNRRDLAQITDGAGTGLARLGNMTTVEGAGCGLSGTRRVNQIFRTPSLVGQASVFDTGLSDIFHNNINVLRRFWRKFADFCKGVFFALWNRAALSWICLSSETKSKGKYPWHISDACGSQARSLFLSGRWPPAATRLVNKRFMARAPGWALRCWSMATLQQVLRSALPPILFTASKIRASADRTRVCIGALTRLNASQHHENITPGRAPGVMFFVSDTPTRRTAHV